MQARRGRSGPAGEFISPAHVVWWLWPWDVSSSIQEPVGIAGSHEEGRS